MFADRIEAELAYCGKTGLFPLMHLAALKSVLAERHPTLAKSAFDAVTASQRLAHVKLADSAALAMMLPWLLEHLQFTEQKLGHDYWPVGLAKNQATLATVIRYLLDDGLNKTAFTAEVLFAGADAATLRGQHANLDTRSDRGARRGRQPGPDRRR